MHCGCPRRSEEKEAKRVFEEIMVENCLNLMEDMNINKHKAH